MYHCEFSLVTGCRFKGVKGAVVANLTFPMTMEVVGHNVEKVDVLDDLWHVVTGRNGLGTRWHGGRQKQAGQLVADSLTFKCQSQLLDQIDKRGAIIRSPAPNHNELHFSFFSI